MNRWALILRNLSGRPLASSLTSSSVALGVMLVCAILLLRAELERRFEPSRGVGLVVGAPGSSLQLVLNAIYHLEQSPGLLPFEVFEELDRHPSTRLAVPYALGDSFRGFRVVGTTEAAFDPRFPLPPAETAKGKFASGGPFIVDPRALQSALALEPAPPEGARRQAVVGAEVAAALALRPGDKIEPTHGLDSLHAHAQAALWEITGILKPTGTPLDAVVFINLDSFYRIPEHAAAPKPGQDGRPGLSAVLLVPRGGMHKALLLGSLRNRPELQVASVEREVRRLMAVVGRVDLLFLWIAALVVVVGLLSVMVAIYNTMNERRGEIAILRALGARRRFVVAVVVGEAAALAASGALAGLLLGHLLVFLVADQVTAAAGFAPDPLRLLPAEPLLLVGVTLCGALAGLAPAWRAYRTDAAANLR